jgi:glucan biosynthesis protein C
MEPSAPRVKSPAVARLYFLDNLRVALTVLVIFAHTSNAYGGMGHWPYRSAHHPQSFLLVGLNGFLQTFFMGSFFFLSGIFSRKALERRTVLEFLKGKAMRLGVPTVVYTLLADPLQTLILSLILPRESPTLQVSHLSNGRGVRGPVWYCALLFILDGVFALYVARFGRPSPSSDPSSKPTLLASVLVLGLLGTAACSFIIRLYYPSTAVFLPLNLRVGYSPQYILAYLFGTRIDRPESVELLPCATTPMLILISAVVAVGSCRGSSAARVLQDYSGGWNSIAVAYAIVNEMVGYLVLGMLFRHFRRCLNFPWRRAARSSYAAFLCHATISIAVEAIFDSWHLNGVVKTAVIGAINSIVSFVAGWSLTQVRGLDRVL